MARHVLHDSLKALVKTGDVDLNSWAHKIERKNELRKKHEKLKKEL